MKLIGVYVNGNYLVKIYDDGTKIQQTDDDVLIPAFAESMDVTITERCNNHCNFCYANCNSQGEHCNFSNYMTLLDSVHPYTEMAINGNNLDHPQLEDFLLYMKSKNVFVNMTVNQIDFEKHWKYLKRLNHENLIRGLGISLNKVTDDFLRYIQFFPNAVIHVINGIFTKEQYKKLKGKGIKLLILGYKYIGRGSDYAYEFDETLENNMNWLFDALPDIYSDFKVISFDNLAINQLEVKDTIDFETWEKYYMGDEGTTSFFVNLVKGYFAINSLSEIHYPIEQGMTFDDMFKIIGRNK